MRYAIVFISLGFYCAARFVEAGSPSPLLRLRVAIVDKSGKPIAKARGVLFKTAPQTGRALMRESPLVITKLGKPLVAGADGVIEISSLPLKQAYVLEIAADGFAPELTRWTHASPSATVDLPAVQLRRLGEIRGSVVDRQGHPVPNATVIQAGDAPKRLEALTNRDGQFTLNGVPEGKAVICFEVPGFRFFGTVVDSPSEKVRIELERVGDSDPRTLQPSTAATHEMPNDRRAAAAKSLVDPIASSALAKKVIDDKDFWMLFIAARLEPERILAKIDDLKFAREARRNQIRNAATFGLFGKGKPEKLLEFAAKLEPPMSRINAYLYWFQNNAQIRSEPAAEREALKRARVLIDASKDDRTRGFWLCELASQLWDLGDHAEAHKVFDECRTILKKMPAGAQGREGFRISLAMAVARESTAEAKEVAGELEPGPMLRLAGEVAGERPQEVEALLASVPGELSLMQLSAVANNLPRVCYRVARRDSAAAERILLKFAHPPKAQSDAESIFGMSGSLFGNLSKELIDFQVERVKAICFGLIAEAATKSNPSAARQALLKAVEIVRPLRTGFVHPATESYHTPCGLMMLLVPIAERMDRALAHEILWRALSLRVPMTGESSERMALDTDLAQLLGILMLYEPSLSSDLLQPLLTREIARSYSGMRIDIWPIRTLAMLDPARAIAFPDKLCDRPGWDGSLPRNSAIQAVANVLSTPVQSDVSGRIKSQLFPFRNAYGAYIETDANEP